MFDWFKSREIDDKHDQKRAVCANCGQTYIEGDRYCRFCGAPMGKPDYIMEDFACIYGPPPVVRQHRCEKCGYQWTTELMIDHERWCPKCGGSAPFFLGDEKCLILKYRVQDSWKQEKICISKDRDATIGRSEECDVTVNDMRISRKQFRILMGDGIDQNAYIENLGKTNPAFINGEPFNGICKLKNGDELSVGTIFFFVYFS